MKVVVEGTDLPGIRCKPAGTGDGYANVHVGLCTRSANRAGPTVVPSRPWHVIDLVPGDAPGARWELDVVVRDGADGPDFGGPFVRGKGGDRHIGLAWGEVPGDGTFRLFRGAKLRLEVIDPAIVRAANQPGARLVARLGLTDAKGQPRCATVRPPAIAWSAQ